MALNLTGQLTVGDGNNVGNNGNYVRLDIRNNPGSIGNSIIGDSPESIVVNVAIWKSKASYTAGKAPGIQSYVQQVTNEIKSQYTVDLATIGLAPSSNFNSVLGKSIYDKHLYWVHQQVLAQIIALNPTFSGTIVDIQL